MPRPRSPAGSPLTWGLAAVFLALIDVGATRTALLWGHTSFEDTRDMARIVFAQTYQAARLIYAPARDARVRVALVGNSRIRIPAQAPYVERELGRLAPGLDVRVDNLGIFGAGMGDYEVLCRHFGRLAPTLVVVAVGTSDLVITPTTPISNLPAELLNVGWRDGALGPESASGRVDRWLRTVWPLYRFREFVRAAIEDRLAPGVDPGPFPDRFASTRALFDYMHGERGGEVEAAYRAWRAEPTLPGFVDYMRVGSGSHLDMVRRRVGEAAAVTEDSPAPRMLDALLARLARGRWTTLVLVMPENPLLDLDRAGEYHQPGSSEALTALVRTLAARHGVRVVDGRRWMPAEAFIDFDHLMPDLSGFQRPLAEEIVRAAGS